MAAVHAVSLPYLHVSKISPIYWVDALLNAEPGTNRFGGTFSFALPLGVNSLSKKAQTIGLRCATEGRRKACLQAKRNTHQWNVNTIHAEPRIAYLGCSVERRTRHEPLWWYLVIFSFALPLGVNSLSKKAQTIGL